MEKSKEMRNFEIDPATMPDGYPCAKCVRSCTIQPCIRFRIFYEEFMHKCRVATGCETPSRERKFQEYVETKNTLDLFGGALSLDEVLAVCKEPEEGEPG